MVRANLCWQSTLGQSRIQTLVASRLSRINLKSENINLYSVTVLQCYSVSILQFYSFPVFQCSKFARYDRKLGWFIKVLNHINAIPFSLRIQTPDIQDLILFSIKSKYKKVIKFMVHYLLFSSKASWVIHSLTYSIRDTQLCVQKLTS